MPFGRLFVASTGACPVLVTAVALSTTSFGNRQTYRQAQHVPC
jgi:hypothetical protein